VQLRSSLVILAAVTAAALPAQTYRTQNLVLVTADGLRWQEVFRGAEQRFLADDDAGMKDAAAVRERFDAPSAEERRQRLMPFLWSVVARQGSLFGNRDKGSEVVLKNRHRFSYPGYSEILTGKPQDDLIDSNDLRPNPTPTVLELLRRAWNLPREKVALFGSWEVFLGIGAHQPDSVFVNAGFRPLKLPGASARLLELSRQQFELLTPWRSVRHDFITFEMALECLRTMKPRVLHVALGETDDWAHDRRYDRYLETAHYFDQCLRRLWEALQADPQYQGRTTLLVTSDHGRGSERDDWTRHGAKVEGAQYVWLATLGPDTAALGEAGADGRLTLSDVAPTMLELAGVDYRELAGVEGKPVRQILRRGDRGPRARANQRRSPTDTR
jgi:hypothetical protein